MSLSTGVTPQILLGKIAVSLRVMAGRQPVVGSFATNQDDLWQAIAAGMIFTRYDFYLAGDGLSRRRFQSVTFRRDIYCAIYRGYFDVAVDAFDFAGCRQAAKIPAFCGAVFMD